jgi:hypothetical protein
MSKQPAKSNMRYDVASLAAGETMLSRWPELANYHAFAEHGVDENDPWLRFVALYADMGSDYRDLPLEDKKRVCMLKAGVPDGSRCQLVASWQDKPVVAMISQYVRLQNSLKYALWFHGCESAAQTIEQLSVPIEGAKDRFGEDDEAKTQTAYKTRRDNLEAMILQVPKLEALGRELFMGDEELREAHQLAIQSNTPTAEKRAESRSFIPATKTK